MYDEGAQLKMNILATNGENAKLLDGKESSSSFPLSLSNTKNLHTIMEIYGL